MRTEGGARRVQTGYIDLELSRASRVSVAQFVPISSYTTPTENLIAGGPGVVVV